MLRKIYSNFEEYFCAFTMAIMVICLMIQVLIRVFAGSSLAWTEELSRYSFLWSVYLGTAVVAKRNAHVRVTAQFMLTPKKVQIAFRAIADTIWVGFTLHIAYISWATIKDSMDFPEISPTLQIMKHWVELIIPIGFVIMSWRVIEFWLHNIKNGTLDELVRDEEGI